MAPITYRIHFSPDLLNPNIAILVTRGRRPNMRDYVSWALKLTEEHDEVVHAIYEEPCPSLDDEPVFELSEHNLKRHLYLAENERMRSLQRPLYAVGRILRDIGQEMEWHLQDVERRVRELRGELSEFEQQGRYDIDVPSTSNIAGSFIGHSGSETRRLGTIARREADLAFTLAQIDELARSLQLKREPCCAEPYYVVEPDTERVYNRAKLYCTNCGIELSMDDLYRIPDIRPAQEEVSDAA